MEETLARARTQSPEELADSVAESIIDEVLSEALALDDRVEPWLVSQGATVT